MRFIDTEQIADAIRERKGNLGIDEGREFFEEELAEAHKRLVERLASRYPYIEARRAGFVLSIEDGQAGEEHFIQCIHGSVYSIDELRKEALEMLALADLALVVDLLPTSERCPIDPSTPRCPECRQCP